MIPVHSIRSNHGRVLWLAVGLALIAASSYLLIQFGLLGVGDLQPAEEPSGIVFVAAGGYLLGGLLILARRRCLWIIGAVINVLVILFFMLAYLHRPAVLFSPGGGAPNLHRYSSKDVCWCLW